ncbi:MAG: hypothetical protein IH940_03400 [Acidobacteria bacterium]|nr:hypothetical protein [Acidobacteriota bacterium]
MSQDRKGQGPIWWLIFAAVLYLIGSGLIAVSTVGNCGDFDAEKEWNIFPPSWECS